MHAHAYVYTIKIQKHPPSTLSSVIALTNPYTISLTSRLALPYPYPYPYAYAYPYHYPYPYPYPPYPYPYPYACQRRAASRSTSMRLTAS